MTEYVKLDEAPDHYHPEAAVGESFSEEMPEEVERAVVAAGWVEPAKAKSKK